jgi:nucleotide-binding universal stress UspA family protein
MSVVVVPVRYPLSKTSSRTLGKAIEFAQDRDASLTVLHVDLYQNSHNVSRRDLKETVEAEFGAIADARYVIRKGFIVEETILEEVAAENADLVVIGGKQAPRWRRLVQSFLDEPNIELFLREKLDCEIITV